MRCRKNGQAKTRDSARVWHTSRIAKIKSLKDEISQIEASLESNAAKFLAENSTDSDKELFFENEEEFYKKTFEKVNNFYKQQLFPKREQAKELETAINNKREQGSLKQAMDTFDQAHSDIKANELLAFAQEELPPPKIAKGFSN